MGDFISRESFYKHAMPCMEKIAKELRARHPVGKGFDLLKAHVPTECSPPRLPARSNVLSR
eukprot:759928-Hanusia_phi.AAC.7